MSIVVSLQLKGKKSSVFSIKWGVLTNVFACTRLKSTKNDFKRVFLCIFSGTFVKPLSILPKGVMIKIAWGRMHPLGEPL